MLRRGPGFFGARPLGLWWRRFWNKQSLRIIRPGWQRWTICFPARLRWGVSQSYSVRSLRRPWPNHGFFTGRMPHLSLRNLVNLLLAASALYFFAGWFGGLRAEPGQALRVAVWRTDSGQTVSMDLEEYLKGVVAAEMPVSFHLEALKAQAVAARTYTLHILATRKGVPGHPDADLSTDPAVDQAWVSENTLRTRWNFLEYYWRWRKISRAVDDTHGLVLTYGGDLIFAAFHSDSGGVTEDSENYWSARIPYLRSVNDPVPVNSPYMQTKVVLVRSSVLEAVQKVSHAESLAVLANSNKNSTSSLVQVMERYPSGRVRWVRVGDKRMSGRALREALGLRSNWFDVREDDQQIEFTVRGNGHGVGMSQYGADAFARQGASYDQILRTYYTGVQLTAKY